MRLRARLRDRVFGNHLDSTSRHVGCKSDVLCMPFELVGLVVVGLVGMVGGIGGCVPVVVGEGEEAIGAVAAEDTVAVVAEDRSDAVAGAEESDEVEDAAAAESKVAAVAGAVGQGYEEELGRSV